MACTQARAFARSGMIRFFKILKFPRSGRSTYANDRAGNNRTFKILKREE
jgi:hypothetical protein